MKNSPARGTLSQSRSHAAEPHRGRALSFEALESRQLLALTHWYTFNAGTGEDLVGTADISLVNGAAVQADRVVLSNTGVTSDQSTTIQYLDMPASALPADGPLTVATWFTATDSANWTRVFDFGNQTGSNGDSYLFFSPQSGLNDSRLVLSTGGGAGGERIASTITSDNGIERMVAAVVDTATDTLRLYLDGIEVGTAPLNGADAGSIAKSVAYFGRSLYNADPGLTGAINEIRIYDDALSAEAIATQAAEGPTVDDPEPPSQLPARQMEDLNRGVIALRRTSSQVYVGWRMLGTDPATVAFNLYRSTSGAAAVKLNASPITQTTDYVDSTANTSASNTYYVRPVIAGIELAPSESFTLPANAPVNQFLNVPLQRPAGGTVSLPPGTVAPPSGTLDYTYNANDASVGDLDGDGQYEIVLKWDPSNSQDNANEGLTGNVIVDAYKLDGTMLWRINLGRNIRAGAHYTQFLVYDFDGDGRAEVVMKTADGTVDGQGIVIGNANADYRDGYSGSGDGRWGRVLGGPEFLTVFDGQTGAALSTIDFSPPRGSVSSWGDSYGNRVDRFLATVAYLDGVHPSIVMARGYYAKTRLTALDWNGSQLTQRWAFDSTTPGNSTYQGQGNHNLSVADVDFDGKDEIIYGAAAFDHDGTGLYTTGLGHGDALHVSDMIPSRPGLEVFGPHESPGSNGGVGSSVRDAATGEIIAARPATSDNGRGVAFDIDPNYPGYEYWSSADSSIYNSSGEAIYGKPGNMHTNFAVWWDADLLRETLDGTTISDWNYTTRGRQNIVSSGGSGINNNSGVSSNNGTKATPALSGDILGDWREEVIWRTSDNQNLRIYSTTISATNRLTTLMHDSQYRSAIAWQNVAYNQPPHPSFFLGAGMTVPPQPNIYLASASPVTPGDFDLDDDVDNDDLAIWQQTYGTSQAQGFLPGDADGDGHVGGRDFLVWQRNFGQGQVPLASEVHEPLSIDAPTHSDATSSDDNVRDSAIAGLAVLLLPSDEETATVTELEDEVVEVVYSNSELPIVSFRAARVIEYAAMLGKRNLSSGESSEGLDVVWSSISENLHHYWRQARQTRLSE